jgi:hypothetical protein
MKNEDAPVFDFLCIGAQKAGTSWLMRNLGSHPQVWTPGFVKEVHYFDSVHLGYGRKAQLKTFRRNIRKLAPHTAIQRAYYKRVLRAGWAFTDEWYRHIFSAAESGSVKGECTPLYSALPEEGIRHVQRLSPSVKLIYMIRDPHARLHSQVRMRIERRGITDFGEIHPLLGDAGFLSRGDYATNIPRWEAVFGESILFIPFGDIKTRPADVMSRIEKHLNIPPYGDYPLLNEAVHPTAKPVQAFPEDLLEKMQTIAEPQKAFLTDHFGADFARSIT